MVEIISDQDGLMTVKASAELLQLFGRLRWFQTVSGGERLQLGQTLYLRDGARIAPYVGLYSGDHVPELGAFSYTSSRFDRMMSIGAYCSISWNVRVMGLDHPLTCFSTTAGLYQRHAIFKAAYDDAGARIRYRANPQKDLPVIGNDVWIGQDVLLGKGISIGDGAVIAAGSTVVKDVHPYQIVGGAPATHIRYRFEEPLQALLQSSSWWDYHLPGVAARWADDVPRFVAELAEDVALGKVKRLTRFKESLTDIIRGGHVSRFLSGDGRSLFVSVANAAGDTAGVGSVAACSAASKAA